MLGNMKQCSMCTASPAQYRCHCEQGIEGLCLSCVSTHIATPIPHFLALTQATHSPPSCSVCAQNTAEVLCVCSFPVPALCSVCKRLHLAPVATALHHLLPISLRESLECEDSYASFRQKVESAAVAERVLKGNLHSLNLCEVQIDSKSTQFATECDRWAANQRAKLAKLKEAVVNELPVAIKAAKNSIFDWSSASLSPLISVFEAFRTSQLPESLQLFKFKENSTEMPIKEAIGVHWLSKIAPNGLISSEYPPKVPISPESTGPLCYSDCETYVNSVRISGTAAVVAKQEFYKAHWQCRQALQQTLAEAYNNPYLEGKKAEWVQEYTAFCEETTRLSDLCRSSLSAQLADLYELKSELSIAHLDNKELSSALSSLISVPTVPRRKRGRPRKITPVDIPRKQRASSDSESSYRVN